MALREPVDTSNARLAARVEGPDTLLSTAAPVARIDLQAAFLPSAQPLTAAPATQSFGFK